MKNVLKIAIVPCYLASLYHGDVSATEKMNVFSESSMSQHKLHLHENSKNGTALANTLEFDKITKDFAQNKITFQKKFPVETETGRYSANNKTSIKNNRKKDFEENLKTSKVTKEIDPRIRKLDPFYNEMNEMTRKARNGDNAAIKEVKNLKSKRKKLDNKVRVRAIKAEGSARGVGLDELFQTAETPYFAMCDAGLVKGKKPSSFLKSGQEFGWLDLQHYSRVATSEPIYKNVNGIIGGHAGALYKRPSPSRGGVLKGQKPAHDKRQEAIKRSSTPGNAAIRAMRSHLESTASRADYQKNDSFPARDTKDRNLLDPKNYRNFVQERLKGRDNVKRALHALERNLEKDSDASSLSSYDISSYDGSYSSNEDLNMDDLRDLSRFLSKESGEG